MLLRNDGVVSHDALELWREYAQIFCSRWGANEEFWDYYGVFGQHLFEAEFKEHGTKAYQTSIILPVRNAWYAKTVIDTRWSTIQNLELNEPILDYGCGVGFTTSWLSDKGLNTIAHDLPGVQHSIAQEVLAMRQIPWWDQKKVGTILCFNVLEHMEDPMALLQFLRSKAKNVIANCVIEDGPGHIAPREAMYTVRKSLEDNGELYVSTICC